MKKIFVILVMFVALQGNAQMLFESSTLMKTSIIYTNPSSKEISYFKRNEINETFYWRKKYNKESQHKSVYNFSSLYKRDSVIGLRLYGMDIDLMSEKFDKRKANNFRQWNHLRLGFALLAESYNTGKTTYEYPDGEIYLSFVHIPPKARGDKTTKSHKNSFEMFILASPLKRFDGYLKYKPFGNVWLKTYYHQERFIPRVGVSVEIETNKNGFKHSNVESSKDIYKGLTFCVSPEIDLKSNRISLSVGIKYDYINH